MIDMGEESIRVNALGVGGQGGHRQDGTVHGGRNGRLVGADVMLQTGPTPGTSGITKCGKMGIGGLPTISKQEKGRW